MLINVILTLSVNSLGFFCSNLLYKEQCFFFSLSLSSQSAILLVNLFAFPFLCQFFDLCSVLQFRKFLFPQIMCSVTVFPQRYAEFLLQAQRIWQLWKCLTLALHIIEFPQFCILGTSHSCCSNTCANSKVKMQKSNQITAVLETPPSQNQPQLSSSVTEKDRNKHKGICGKIRVC